VGLGAKDEAVFKNKRPKSSDQEIVKLLGLVSEWLVDAELRGLAGGFVPLAQSLRRNLREQLAVQSARRRWWCRRRCVSTSRMDEFFRLQARIDHLCQRLGTCDPPWVIHAENSANEMLANNQFGVR